MHSRIEIPQPGGLRREQAECGLKVAARRGALVRHVEDSKTVGELYEITQYMCL
jgi:hypothetical protein